MAAVRIAQHFPALDCSVRRLYEARRQAQETAYRANELGKSGQDVPIRQILAHQAALAGLPPQAVEELVDIELDIEALSLLPHRALVTRLREARQRGTRVIAISDTPLSAVDLSMLLQSVLGETLFDRIYTSADCGGCKYNGKLFRHVQQAEGIEGQDICHIGDNRHADGKMATLAGAHAFIRRRSWGYHASRICNAAMFRLSLLASQGTDYRAKPASSSNLSPRMQKARVLGPLVAEYCLRLWLYLSHASQTDECVALFCARGGIGQRIAFEKFLLRTGLNLKVRRENLLVSRVIAARGAVLSQSPAAADALMYEFQGDSLRNAAEALASQPLSLGAAWDQPFEGTLFFSLLREDPAAGTLRSILVDQNARFDKHLDALIGSAKRVLLCDTGLYGSTVRLLQAARPDVHFELLLLARSNYRDGDASHFTQTVGLLNEADRYSIHKRGSIVLRYWHLIESLFELAVPSAKTFPCDATLQSMSGDMEKASFRKIEHLTGESFQAACDYLEGLPRYGFFERILSDSSEAWRRFRSIVITPSPADIDLWATGPRGRDFGRLETVESIAPARGRGLSARVQAVRSSRWKEGAIARHFGWCRTPAQWLLETAYLSRAAVLPLLGLLRRKAVQPTRAANSNSTAVRAAG